MQNILIFMQQHLWLCLAFLIIIILLIVVEFYRSKNSTQLKVPQAIHLINRENAVVVDIRSKEAFLSGHIVGAISIPLADLTTKIKKFDKFKSQPIILVCANGLESSRASHILAKHHISSLTLAGGIRSWTDAGMPLTKDE